MMPTKPPTPTLSPCNVSYGQTKHAFQNLDHLRLQKSRIHDEIDELKRKDDFDRAFDHVKHDALFQLEQMYVEFALYMSRFLDTTSSCSQQKFVYWTNLKRFTQLQTEHVGCDLPSSVQAELDKLFGRIQANIREMKDWRTVRTQLDESKVYHAFLRSNPDESIKRLLLAPFDEIEHAPFTTVLYIQNTDSGRRRVLPDMGSA